MNIKKISIKNFRNFGEETSFNLNPQLTTIIGINGKGKSSVLTALKIAAGTYLLGIPDAGKRHIDEDEIRLVDFKNHLARRTPTFIKAEGSIDGKNLRNPWKRIIPEGRFKTTAYIEDIGEIRKIALDKYISYQSGPSKVDNPVILFFGTARLYGNARQTLGPYIGREVFKYGYYNWYNMQYGTYNYPNWLKGHKFMVAEKKESPTLYNAFINCIKTANPYIEAIGFDGEELRLKVKIQEDESESPFLPLSLLSDGIRTLTAMVAELAYRCIMLNAHHGIQAITKSRGIVMIDEIDMHIHPIWQRHILKDLKDAFPNIQFVVTTHSPYIVQSLESNELINLDVVADATPNEMSLDEVSTQIMQVDSEFSEENMDKFQMTKSVLGKINRAIENSSELSDEISKISDPVLRAFAELNKLAKGNK